MEQLLQYMYRGEINVLQDDLGPLIETARALQVKGLADAPPGAGGTQQPKKRPTPPPGVLPPPLQQHPPPLKKAKTNNSSSKKESQMRHPPLPTSQLAQRLTQPKRPPFMPPLPTEPEPPESIRGKEDQIDLYGAPVFGDQDNNSGDGTDYGTYTETELHTDEDSNYPQIDQVSNKSIRFHTLLHDSSTLYLKKKSFHYWDMGMYFSIYPFYCVVHARRSDRVLSLAPL